MKLPTKKSFILCLTSALILMGCSSSRIAETLNVIIAVPLMIVGLPLVYGAMAIEGEINYHKYYSNQDYMIGKEYELTQDAFLYQDSKEKKIWLDRKYVDSHNFENVVPAGTRLTITHVYVYRANVEIGAHYHIVLAKFSLEHKEINANISKLFDSSCAYSNSEENFIVNPSIMIELLNFSEN